MLAIPDTPFIMIHLYLGHASSLKKTSKTLHQRVDRLDIDEKCLDIFIRSIDVDLWKYTALKNQLKPFQTAQQSFRGIYMDIRKMLEEAKLISREEKLKIERIPAYTEALIALDIILIIKGLPFGNAFLNKHCPPILNKKASRAFFEKYLSSHPSSLAVSFVNLDHVGLNTLLPLINQFTQLKSLSLFGNRLSKLSSKIHLFELETLNLCENRMQCLPRKFIHPNLRCLYLAKNKLKILCEEIHMPKLEKINLQHNQISHLPRGFSKLKLHSLYLGKNKRRSDKIEEKIDPFEKRLCAR